MLPPPYGTAGDSTPRQLDGDVLPPVGVPSRLSEITDLEVMVVNRKERLAAVEHADKCHAGAPNLPPGIPTPSPGSSPAGYCSV